jgi:hypothetical protein
VPDKILGSTAIDSYIPRWALPRENIPLHIRLDRDIQFDYIVISLKEGFELIEVLNSDNYAKDNNDLIIYSVKRSKYEPGIFLGLVIRYNKIPINLKLSENINIRFIKNDETIFSCHMECRIFRPSLILSKIPDMIELTDDLKSNKIGLDLQFVGFGDISLQLIAKIGGKIVSQGDSLIYEVLLRLMDKLKEADENHCKKSIRFTIEPGFVRNVIDKFQEMIDNRELPSEILTEDDIKTIQDYLAELKRQEDYSDIIFEETNDILLSILTDTLERNPESNIELRDIRTNIKTKIDAPINKIHLKIKYKDAMENDYPAIEVQIPVHDKLKTHKNASIEIPIKIENIDNRHYMNVRDIDMGG